MGAESSVRSFRRVFVTVLTVMAMLLVVPAVSTAASGRESSSVPEHAAADPPGPARPAQTAGAPEQATQNSGDLQIEVLSSPPQYVSGGDARILVHVPDRIDPDDIVVRIDGSDVTDAFLPAGDHTLEGVVTGLPIGDSELVARVDGSGQGQGGRHASITLTNHPRSGPMFSGPQQEPFGCTTEGDLSSTGVGSGPRLGEAEDQPEQADGCEMETVVSYLYRPVGEDGWEHYDPASPPTEIAEAETIYGETIPLVVRWERGTINRFIYSIAVPTPPPVEGGAQESANLDNWNERLIYHFQGGVGIGHYQGDPSRSRMLYEFGLTNGYAIAYSTGTKTGVHYNLQLGGETAMMVKDRFVTAYDDPLYTVGVGGSGGAIQQYVYGQNHPGLIDAAIPQYSYPDMITQTIHVGDCELLERWADFQMLEDGDAFWQTWSNRQLIEGLNAVDAGVANSTWPVNAWMPMEGSTECIEGWRGLSPLALNPNFGWSDGLSVQQNLQVEWTHYADAINIYGEGEDGFARRTWDNVGVQYGLQALLDGDIDAEEFLDLNWDAGSWKNEPEMAQEGCPFLDSLCPTDPTRLLTEPFLGDTHPDPVDPWSMRNMNLAADGDPAPRAEADPGAIEAAYTSGLVFRGDIDIPIIDWRHYLEPVLDMHNSHQSFASRQRMLNHDGDASNQVIWFTDGVTENRHDQTPMAFEVMDDWMANLREHPERGVAGNKPSDAVDSCFDANGELLQSGNDVWDGILNDAPAGDCTQEFPVYSTSRIVAGGPITGDVFKCELQPVRAAVARGVYGDWEPTSEQVATLEEIFPDGVCDYRKGDARRPAWLR